MLENNLKISSNYIIRKISSNCGNLSSKCGCISPEWDSDLGPSKIAVFGFYLEKTIMMLALPLTLSL